MLAQIQFISLFISRTAPIHHETSLSKVSFYRSGSVEAYLLWKCCWVFTTVRFTWVKQCSKWFMGKVSKRANVQFSSLSFKWNLWSSWNVLLQITPNWSRCRCSTKKWARNLLREKFTGNGGRNWSFPLIEQEFRETDKSLKHELGSVKRSCLLHVSCLHCGSILVSYKRSGWVACLSRFTVMTNIFLTEFAEVGKNI